MKINYKLALVPTSIILLMAIAVLVSGYLQTGELFSRSIELRGGTQVTVSTDSPVNTDTVTAALSGSVGEVSVKQTRGVSGNGLIIQADANVSADAIISALSGMGIKVADYSAQTIGPELGASFWSQAQLAIIFAFVMMAIIVFVIFRNPIPSAAVILCAFSDIIVTIAGFRIFGMEISLAGLAALLMLIGYSVDTDILLTTRVLKGSGNVGGLVKNAFKTGITMTLTTIGALATLLVMGISPVLSQIATVLLIGLVTDIFMTWLQNAAIIRWYMERKGIV